MLHHLGSLKSVNEIGTVRTGTAADKERDWKVSRNRPSIERQRIVEDPLPNNVRWLANASDANDKQTNRGLSRITSPRGVLSCCDEPGSIPRSLVPNIIHHLSRPSVMAYTTPTPPLTCQVRDAVYQLSDGEKPWRTPSAKALLFDRYKRERLPLCVRRGTFTTNRVWQKDDRRCKWTVYTERCRKGAIMSSAYEINGHELRAPNIWSNSFYNLIEFLYFRKCHWIS